MSGLGRDKHQNGVLRIPGDILAIIPQKILVRVLCMPASHVLFIRTFFISSKRNSTTKHIDQINCVGTELRKHYLRPSYDSISDW